MRDDRERLCDIQEAIANIEKYSIRGRQAFDEDELIQTWIVHPLQIIGEASAAMSEAFVNNHPQVPWRDIADFRNVLVHEYFQVDMNIVWLIVQRQLPELKSQIDCLLLAD